METLERRPGRRPLQRETWKTCLVLDERHRERLTALADERQTSIAHEVRSILDQALEVTR
jgi:hypothetical protein